MSPVPSRVTHPLIAVSAGDPGGIGPEVLVKSLADAGLRERAAWVVFGDDGALTRAANRAGIAPYWRAGALSGAPPARGEVALLDGGVAGSAWVAGDTREGGEASFAWVCGAIDLARRPAADPWRAGAVVTGPISKAAWSLAGRHYPGHTELLGERFGVREFAMMFVSERLNVILATAHVALARVAGELDETRLVRTIALGHGAMRRLGVGSPRIAVCGLNPHAGESGLLGEEDGAVIAPAVRAARAQGIDVQGPFAADTVFLRAIDAPGRARRFDLVVAMYHDQGLIPLKLLARDSAVNVTVGLPVARTSPDHGTAFDIAGRNQADPGSMHHACGLGVRLASV